jgi:hypothetical protein
MPPSSAQPSHAEMAAHPAQSSPMSGPPCGGHRHIRLGEDHPLSLSMVDGALHALRVWFNEHNLMHYRPSTPPPPFRQVIVWDKPVEASPLRITELNWRDISFTDDDPDHPLTMMELREKVGALVLDENNHGFLPTLKTGEIRVVLDGKGHEEIRYFRPASESGLQHQTLASSDGERTTTLDWRDPVFFDEDPEVILSDDEMKEKISAMIRKVGPNGGYLPWLKSGIISTVVSGPGYTNTQVYLPGASRLNDAEVRGRLSSGSMRTGIRPATPADHSRYAAAVDHEDRKYRNPPIIHYVTAENGREGEVRVMNIHGQPHIFDSRPASERTVKYMGGHHGVHAFAGHGDERPGGGLHGKGGWHHRRPQTFTGRYVIVAAH